MNNMRKYINAGLVHFMAYPEIIRGNGPIAEKITETAIDNYFDSIEVTRVNDPEEKEKVKKILKSSKLNVYYGGQPRLLTTGLNINDLNEEKRLEALQSLKDGIDEAIEFGALGFGFLSGKYEEETKEESYKALVKSTKELCEYASKSELKVVLEIFDYDIDKKSLIGPTSLAKRFADEIKGDHDNFGLMIDLSHIPMYYESYKEAIEPILDHIVHVHIGNTVIKSKEMEAYGDAHPRFGFENGENDVDEVAKFLQELIDLKYLDGITPKTVSFEVKPWKDEDSRVVIENAKRTLNLAWTKIKL